MRAKQAGHSLKEGVDGAGTDTELMANGKYSVAVRVELRPSI
jgi:hypothetical protein